MNWDAFKPEIATLATRHQLEVVALFGSQATGRTHRASDIDIAVLSRAPVDITRLMMEFSDVFKRADVEVVNLGTASPTLMYVVVRDGRLLYEREPALFRNWKWYAIRVWLDTAWLRKLRDRKLLDWARQVEIKSV